MQVKHGQCELWRNSSGCSIAHEITMFRVYIFYARVVNSTATAITKTSSTTIIELWVQITER